MVLCSAVVLDVGIKAKEAVSSGELQEERCVIRRVVFWALRCCGEDLGGRL